MVKKPWWNQEWKKSNEKTKMKKIKNGEKTMVEEWRGHDWVEKSDEEVKERKKITGSSTRDKIYTFKIKFFIINKK